MSGRDNISMFEDAVTTWHSHICTCSDISSHFKKVCFPTGDGEHTGQGGGHTGDTESLAIEELLDAIEKDKENIGNGGTTDTER